MKKLPFLLIAMLGCMISSAQVSKDQHDSAIDLLKKHSESIGLSSDEVENVLISATYQTGEGIRMIYLQQGYKNLPVFNQMIVLAFKNDKLVSNTGTFIHGIEKFINTQNVNPALAAAEAVKTAFKEAKISLPVSIVPLNAMQNGRVIDFGNLNIASENITAELMWVPTGGKENNVKLTWQVKLFPLVNSDYWYIRVDANTNTVISKNNLTVYDQWNKSFAANTENLTQPVAAINEVNVTSSTTNSPLLVGTANYLVIPYPAESPIHPGGTAALRTNPWMLADGNAVSLGWQNNGTSDYIITRGNNVHAHEDRASTNSNTGIVATSGTSPDPLNFNFPPNYTLAPTTAAFQQFAITNLFYWNNIMHDISYNYGFNEPSGNFQASNQGRGGTGNDYVQADAQDGSGTNNANFSTPVDGSSGRMQMYLFTGVTPNRDGDIDNGIIAHEYTHGISTRLTGGPANSSCLNNAEQGGEGWSDFFALMTTTNWSTAQVTDGALARPLGTYVLNQAITGAGIRVHPYSTNLSIDPWTYANMAASGGEVHTIGEIWCTALWEMTWEMIAQDGINTNLFNAGGTGGNSAAMKLVIEGMRLQPCSPGYIDARNAILKADTLFFGAKYSCAIWRAFAKRGMGKNASQGSSNSTTDQVADFTANGSTSLLLTQNVTQQEEGLNIVYTNHVSSGACGALANYTLRDTLPSNVNYISGGTYNAGTRVVSFPVNLASGVSQDYSFTVQINPGSYFVPVSLLNEMVAGAAIPATWTAAAATGPTNWAVSTTQSHSPTRSFFAADNATAITDFRLATSNAIALGANPPTLNFWHYYNLEAGWDGGVVEISTNGGSTWTDLGSNITANGYNGSVGGTNPIAGRSAFTGNSNGFIQTKISLAAYANQTALIRFRATSDDNTAATGWYVDDIQMNSIAVVNMRSGLFNATDVRIALSDTITAILPASCTPGIINNQPVNVSGCPGTTAVFTINASGTALSYQWQVSTDAGLSFTNLAGSLTNTLTLTGIGTAMNNNQYRCVINGTCTTALTSNPAILSVNVPAAPSGSGNVRCGAGPITVVATSNAGETIDWYAAATGGTALQTGSASYIIGLLSATTTYYAEARNITTGCVSAGRTAVTATINSLPVAPSGSDAARCGPGTITISVTNGSGETTDWYAAVSGGTALQTGSASYTIVSLNTTTTYYAEARNTTTGCVSVGRTPVTATVNSLPVAPSGSDAARCGPGTITISVTNGSGETTDWYSAASGGNALQTGSASYTISSQNVTTTYYAEGRNIATGCVSLTRTPVTATVNAVPAIPSAGINAIICTSGSATLFATPGPGETIDWYGTSSGGSALSTGSGSYITPTISSTTTYYAEARNITTGCISASRSAVTATVIASSSSSTPITICATQLPFIWNEITYNTGGVYVVHLTNAAGCDSTATLYLDVAPAINLYTVTGGGSYISGGPGIVIGLNGSQTGVNYQLLIGGIATGSTVPGTGSAISFGNQTTAGTYTITGTSPICSNTMTGNTTITIISGPPIQYTVTGGGTYCSGAAGAGVGLSGSQVGVNYQLKRNNGTVNVGTPVAGTGSALSFGLQSVADTYTVLATNTVSFVTQPMLNTVFIRIALLRAPTSPAAITGPSDACPFIGAGAATYTIRQAANATSYSWTAPAGATIIGSSTDTLVTVQYSSSFVSGNLSVYSINGCFGNSASTARTLAITRKIPSTPGSITSSLTNPCGIIGTGSTATYNIRQVQYATFYTWTLSTGISFVSNQGDTAVVVKFENGFITGTVSVTASNNCAVSNARLLAVTATVPASPAIINGQSNVCNIIGQTATGTYSVATVAGAGSYAWVAPSNANIVSGQGTTTVQVSFGAAFSGGNLTVKAVAACGSSSIRSLALIKTVARPGTITASALPCPSATVVYTIDPVPFANSYLWSVPSNATYVSGQGTTGFTVTYKPIFISGTVTVKSVNNCSTSSVSSLAVAASQCSSPPPPKPIFVYNAPLTENEKISAGIYPNPNTGIFKINFSVKPGMNSIKIFLTDIYGNMVLQQIEKVNKDGSVLAAINANIVSTGVYEIHYNNGTEAKSMKVIITR